MEQPAIVHITSVIKKSLDREGREVEYINIYGLGSDGDVYEWFKNPGEWRPFKSSPRHDDAF